MGTKDVGDKEDVGGGSTLPSPPTRLLIDRFNVPVIPFVKPLTLPTDSSPIRLPCLWQDSILPGLNFGCYSDGAHCIGAS
jgi:hypothetical protein